MEVDGIKWVIGAVLAAPFLGVCLKLGWMLWQAARTVGRIESTIGELQKQVKKHGRVIGWIYVQVSNHLQTDLNKLHEKVDKLAADVERLEDNLDRLPCTECPTDAAE